MIKKLLSLFQSKKTILEPEKPQVNLIAITKGAGSLIDKNAQEVISYIARVSNPNNQLNFDTSEGLIKYCIKKNHWSIFEQAYMTLEINTTRAISPQILRHKSFTFQEFCLDGDSRITISKEDGTIQRIPIRELFEKWNSKKFKTRNARSYLPELNRFIDAPILSVYNSGEKKVYEYSISYSNSIKTIKCTREHKVFTKEKGFVPFSEAYIQNLTVALNGYVAEPLSYQLKETLEEYAWMGSTKYAEKFEIAPITARKWFNRHKIRPENPNNWPRSNVNSTFRVKLHSFMKWARINIRKSNCEFCGHNGEQYRLELSHIVAHDGSASLAFDENNIQTLCSKCHRSFDLKNQNKKYGWTLALGAKWGKIIEEKYLGIRETYDIEMDHPSHNFVADGVVVHNSQRYADVNLLPEILQLPELRRQDTKNRQNSVDNFSENEKQKMSREIERYFNQGLKLYNKLLSKGVAKECARNVLVLSTPTRIYMTGNVRSWIHYIALREKSGTQKEHMDIAKACKSIFKEQFPICYEALGGDNEWEL